MPKFGAESKFNLAQAQQPLQDIFNEVIKEVDCKVLDAQRGKREQEQAFARGRSKAHFGQSAHNYSPAVAVDVVPWPLDWKDTAAFKRLAVVVKRVAKEKGIAITWGGDWKTLVDMPHYELAPLKTWMGKSKLIVGEPPRYKKGAVVAAPKPTPVAVPPKPAPRNILEQVFGKEKKVTDTPKSNWLSSFVGTTAFKYIIAIGAGWLANKLGLDPTEGKASLEGIFSALVSAAMLAWGAWESSRSKLVVDGKKVSVSNMSDADQKIVANIVKKPR